MMSDDMLDENDESLSSIYTLSPSQLHVQRPKALNRPFRATPPSINFHFIHSSRLLPLHHLSRLITYLGYLVDSFFAYGTEDSFPSFSALCLCGPWGDEASHISVVVISFDREFGPSYRRPSNMSFPISGIPPSVLSIFCLFSL
nr:hypothetical protein T01H8.4 - Caenorhabditis elegans [Caenorhabditis elegans]